MRESFDKAFEFTIGVEGGYVNDPSDSGGETKYGISKRWHPDEDIKGMTLERAKELYLDGYWTPCKCDSVVYPLDCILFDTAVNMGNNTAKALFSRCNDNAETYLELRRMRYDDIVFRNPKQKRFIKGWYNRIERLKEEYLA